jgi:hypothetical protein
MDRLETYLVRRIKRLLADGWDQSRIVQQLEAVASLQGIKRPKAYIGELIEKVSQ